MREEGQCVVNCNEANNKSSGASGPAITPLINILHVLLLLAIPMSLILFSCSKGSDKKELNTFLFSAVSQGSDRTIRDLLRKGADVNLQDKNGCTPLSIAAIKGNVSTVKLFLESGADANVPCNHGPNPLNIACSLGYETIVRLLLLIKGLM
jgi:ankyrin repeat protein